MRSDQVYDEKCGQQAQGKQKYNFRGNLQRFVLWRDTVLNIILNNGGLLLK